MALNLSALNKEYDSASSNSGDYNGEAKVEWLKIKNGDNFFHILPPVNSENPDLPFYEVVIHFLKNEEGKKFVYQCSKKYENKCAICDKYWNLKSSKNAQDQALAKDMRPQRKFLYNAFQQETATSPEGVSGVLTAGLKCHQEILFQIREDVAAGFDPTDYKQGAIVKVVRTGKELETVYKAIMMRNRNTLSQVVADSHSTLPDLAKLYDVYTNEELKQVMNGNFDPKGKMNSTEESTVSKVEPVVVASAPVVAPIASQPVATVATKSKLTPEQQAELDKLMALMGGV